ncbi:hypothetical protein [Brumimicrobium aurantiacum]|uniref:Lipoprotein n=1 Tax=Brumimicrobium aurantiacum TaxID=1737063 RepID=A0A3E1EXI3_9FLAO|nr:hypothetical protein [Brumimicrobium aurantiacum]RFC54247.1 hypothetical protein DXU93_09685 [Brumimicrobium aurantiacum]
MKLFFTFLSALFFVSCSNQPLCDCVQAGDEVNRISASFFDRAPTKAGEDSLRLAKENRDKLCAPFQDMAPQELHERAAECASLEFSAE